MTPKTEVRPLDSGQAILPSLVDQRLREEDLGLREIRRLIPRECLRPQPLRSWWTLIRILICAAVCLYLISLVQPSSGISLFWQLPVLVALWIFYGWVLVGLFALGHECGHYSFSKVRWINTLIGHLCMAPLANGFHSWKLTHNHHHAYTQLRGQEVDWAVHLMTREELNSLSWKKGFMTRLGYALPFGILLWISWNALRRGFALSRLLPKAQWKRERHPLMLSNLATLLILALLYGGLWHQAGLAGVFRYFGIPAAIAMLTGWTHIILQHAGENSILYEKDGWTPARGQLVSTFDIRFPAWLEYLWCNVNIHIPHHISPGIPWYHLKKVSEIIRTAHPNYYQQQRFKLSHLTWFSRTPFLRKVEEKGYYVLESLPRSQDAPANGGESCRTSS